MIVFQVMGPKLQLFLIIICMHSLLIEAQTYETDYNALISLMTHWKQTPLNWVGSDPCGNSWDGIQCVNSRVASIILSGIGLIGNLSEDIQYLSELQTLDLSSNRGLAGAIPPAIGNLKKLSSLVLAGCSFSGSIPDTIGSLTQLISLDLNSNQFTGKIPLSVGKLSNLYLLDLTENQLNGTIPVSDGTQPGLDMLINTKHFHLGQNQLSGTIPPQLFSPNMTLIHLLVDSNQLHGNIPSTIVLVQTLEVLRLDSNSLNGPIPLNLTKLGNMSQLYLSNNQLTGPLPNLTGMNLLTYVDMSNNSFDVSNVSTWFPSLEDLSLLTSLIMENTRLQGQIPVTLFSLPQLQTVVLQNNQIDGTLDIETSHGSQLQLVNLKNNDITKYVLGTAYNNTLILSDNPICENTQVVLLMGNCTVGQQQNTPYVTPLNNCTIVQCSSGQICSPNCKCANPLTGTLHFMSRTFSALGNSSYYISLQESLLDIFQSKKLPVDSVSLSDPFIDVFDYLELTVDIFPLNRNRFTVTDFAAVLSTVNNLTFLNHSSYFGPSYFTIANNGYFTVNKSSSIGVIIGAATAGSILALLLLVAGIYAYSQKRKADKANHLNNPFASWELNEHSGSRPQIKGVKCFSFQEIKKCTNNFSDENLIGTGGYGKVYVGDLATGEPVAIKRAQQGSLQGSLEFKSEIELLSRVHHKNLVGLVGFCYELGEQMLVYEYISKGTLRESLSGKSGIHLNWIRRLQIALDSARGLAYLHEFANPPIIHRDIKSTNILLDDQLNAKVADFGLSTPISEIEKGDASSVKGTLGYLDPEYFMTQQFNEKSDVYSYGVVLLELLTGRNPIERKKYIVREVQSAMDMTKELCGLQEILDPAIGMKTTVTGLENFVDLAMKCVNESRPKRPTMGEVVKEIEKILQLVGLDPNAESVSTSANKNHEANKGSTLHSHGSATSFQYSGSFPL
ncbi:Pkinase_Tyr domain-containing protein [Cephalotus follicularis]|uniref:non-specific serine/threonine protein kinase n=1 Tax=Cephalotus follicularis TaxID=3775 RepID=A0A1Q3CAW1_CEPFO|nr:Pkinase_Tyr domain-containing protein [Cephalotus follicularis]